MLSYLFCSSILPSGSLTDSFLSSSFSAFLVCFLCSIQLVKRIRKVKTLAYIISYLKSQMPSLMGKEKKQAKLIADLPSVFRIVMKSNNLAPGDFPVSYVGMQGNDEEHLWGVAGSKPILVFTVCCKLTQFTPTLHR